MDFKITTSGKLKDIWAMRSFAMQLLGRKKYYNDVLKHILSKDFFYDDSIEEYPTLKQIQEALKLTPSILKKHIDLIYSDLEDIHFNKINYTIPSVEYLFCLAFVGQYAVVKLENLPVCPREGESITLPFFKEKVQTSDFYVRSVHHEFTDKKQIVRVDLIVGHYNRYWAVKKDEEYAKGNVKVDEYQRTDEGPLRKRYGLRWI